MGRRPKMPAGSTVNGTLPPVNDRPPTKMARPSAKATPGAYSSDGSSGTIMFSTKATAKATTSELPRMF